MNEFTISQIEVGLEASFDRTITPDMENDFRRITGDENPLHKDDEFAKEVSGGKFLSHACFGMLTASFYSTLAGMYLPGKYSLIHSLENISFNKPVFVGDVLTISGKVIEKQEELGLIIVKADIKNQDKKTVSRAKMKILVMK